MSPLRRFLRVGAIVLVIALVAVFAVQRLTRDRGLITITATFDDVIDLVTAAHVRAGDVPVGTVTGIELTEEHQAHVTMQIDPDTGLPTDTEAVLSKTSLLGERFVDLRPVGSGGELRDGQELPARIIRDFEDLVVAGADVLSLVAADQLAAAVRTGAEAFGGRGSTLGGFLEDVQAVVGRYEEDQDDLLRLIDALDGVTAAYATNADANAQGFAILERASRALEDEDDRLLDTLEDLTDLSRTGSRILEDHQDELENVFRRVRMLLEQISHADRFIQRVLTWAPRHNIHVPNGSVISRADGPHFAQVWLDFNICGLQDEQGDFSEDCTPPNPGEPGPQYPYHPTSEECWDDLRACEKPEESGP